jgi:hypothetical protein
MSVLIKGMEMPNVCAYCFIDPSECNLHSSVNIWRERHPDCPLTELPPHGRLGDLDKLNIHDISPVDGFCVMGVTEEDIELADTVIEAEGET